ncbi:hypothetical protein [Peijinzhouia sedimentorum]
MLHIRVVKTNGTSLRLSRFSDIKTVNDIGSGSTDEEIAFLQEIVGVFIADYTKQMNLFKEFQPNQ